MLRERIRKHRGKPDWYHRLGRNPWLWTTKITRHLSRRRQRAIAEEMQPMLVAMHQGDYAGLEAYRRERLAAIVDYAYRHCRYYRRLFDQVGLDRRGLSNFDRLPLLDKATIRAQMFEVMPGEIRRLDFHVQQTGGSTGQPFPFPLSYLVGQIDRVHREFVDERLLGHQPGEVGQQTLVHNTLYHLWGCPIPADEHHSLD